MPFTGMAQDTNPLEYDLRFYYDSSDNLIATATYKRDPARDDSAKTDIPATPASDTDLVWIDWVDDDGATVDTSKTRVFWARAYGGAQ